MAELMYKQIVERSNRYYKLLDLHPFLLPLPLYGSGAAVNQKGIRDKVLKNKSYLQLQMAQASFRASTSSTQGDKSTAPEAKFRQENDAHDCFSNSVPFLNDQSGSNLREQSHEGSAMESNAKSYFTADCFVSASSKLEDHDPSSIAPSNHEALSTAKTVKPDLEIHSRDTPSILNEERKCKIDVEDDTLEENKNTFEEVLCTYDTEKVNEVLGFEVSAKSSSEKISATPSGSSSGVPEYTLSKNGPVTFSTEKEKVEQLSDVKNDDNLVEKVDQSLNKVNCNSSRNDSLNNSFVGNAAKISNEQRKKSSVKATKTSLNHSSSSHSCSPSNFSSPPNAQGIDGSVDASYLASSIGDCSLLENMDLKQLQEITERCHNRVIDMVDRLTDPDIKGFVLVIAELVPNHDHRPVAGGIVELLDDHERSIRGLWCRRSLPENLSYSLLEITTLRLIAHAFEWPVSPGHRTRVTGKLISTLDDSILTFPFDVRTFFINRLLMSRHWETLENGGNHNDCPTQKCKCSKLAKQKGAWQFWGISETRFIKFCRTFNLSPDSSASEFDSFFSSSRLQANRANDSSRCAVDDNSQKNSGAKFGSPANGVVAHSSGMGGGGGVCGAGKISRKHALDDESRMGKKATKFVKN